MATKAEKLSTRVQGIVKETPCRMGVSVRLVGRDAALSLNSEEQFPLASVYKVPLLATLFHKVSKGELSLDHRIILRDEEKALGSGDLRYFRPGMYLTVHDLCYLMIVHSDNTATDMIHYLLGFDAPNEYMRSLGLNSIDIHCPNREYFLILLGWASRFKGKSLREVAGIWKGLSRDERLSVFREVREEAKQRPFEEMSRAAIEQWGFLEENETADMRLVEEVMDNPGSPADIAKLLELIASNKIAPKDLTDQMLEYMLLCDSRDRLRARLPEDIMCVNKTGSVSGTVNDCGIIYASKKSTVACACFAKHVKYKDRKTVEAAISEIGLEVYRAFRA
ncbi:MAG: serine hydrolase [Thermoplasmata archaeon]